MMESWFDIVFFFFNDTATTEIYTLSLHDALPILLGGTGTGLAQILMVAIPSTFIGVIVGILFVRKRGKELDRKSTRLNSSHGYISYAVFCLKKKNNLRGANSILARRP